MDKESFEEKKKSFNERVAALRSDRTQDYMTLIMISMVLAGETTSPKIVITNNGMDFFLDNELIYSWKVEGDTHPSSALLRGVTEMTMISLVQGKAKRAQEKKPFTEEGGDHGKQPDA